VARARCWQTSPLFFIC